MLTGKNWNAMTGKRTRGRKWLREDHTNSMNMVIEMPDENQILLKVPRHHNMYSFDMKTPTPAKGFACLIAKATSDESNLLATGGLGTSHTPKLIMLSEEKMRMQSFIVVPSAEEPNKYLSSTRLQLGSAMQEEFLVYSFKLQKVLSTSGFVDPDLPKKVYRWSNAVYGLHQLLAPEVYVSTPITTNEKGVSDPKSKEVEHSYVSHIKTPRQPIKDQATPKVNRKNWNAMMERELGEGYSFTNKKCFVCVSLSHLIKDYNCYEKKMARETEVKKQRVFNTGNGVAKPVWTNANRVNHSNKFVPRSVQLNAGRPDINLVRPNINTGRTNINSVRPNINTGRINVNPVRPRVNTGSSNVNTVRSRQTVPTRTSNNLSPKRPQVNQFNKRGHFSKSYSSVRRPFAKTTAQMSHSNAVKGNWGSAVKTSAGYNWRNSKPNFNCDSGPTFIRTVNAKGSSTEEHGIAWICRSSTTSLVPKPSNFSVQVTTFYYYFRFMAQLKYCDKHNQVGFLRKPDESAGFAEIVDFLRGSNLRYALTTNPTIYDSLVKQFWQTATANTLADGTLELQATIDTIVYTITEASIRNKLQLADASGITMLPNNEIFEGMGHMGYPTDGSFTFWKSFFTPQWRFLVHHLLHCISSKSGGWDQFGSNIATALICLSTGRVYNFSKLIFDGMVANLKSKTKFLMYPRFLQLILEIQTENKHPYLAVTLTKKIFGNMKRGFRGAPRPLLPAMLLVATTNPNAGQEHPDVAQSQPPSSIIPVASTYLPQEQSPPPIRQMTVDDLLQLVPQQMTRVDSLEKDLRQTKLTMGSAIVKLVKKVKKLHWRRKETKGKKVVTSLDFQEEVSTGAKGVNTTEGVNTGSIKVSTVSGQIRTHNIKKSIPSPDKGQREGKDPMIIEETHKKTKE
ncbi:hypothetical protein Tco_0168784 [Tanacetum coccineum]